MMTTTLADLAPADRRHVLELGIAMAMSKYAGQPIVPGPPMSALTGELTGLMEGWIAEIADEVGGVRTQ